MAGVERVQHRRTRLRRRPRSARAARGRHDHRGDHPRPAHRRGHAAVGPIPPVTASPTTTRLNDRATTGTTPDTNQLSTTYMLKTNPSGPAGENDMMRRRWSFLAVSAAALGLLAAGAPGSVLAEPVGNDCLAASPPGCYTPQQFRTAYNIQPLLDRGIDGRGETVSMIVYAASPTASPPQVTDISQDLATFDGLFHLPPAHIGCVTTLAGASAPWMAGTEEVMDTEMVHAVAPGAALRVVLMPASPQDTPASDTAAMLAALPLAIRDSAVVSFSGALGEHFFSPAQVAEMRGILRDAAARRVTVVAASGDSGAVSDVYDFGTAPVKEVSLPASDPFVLAVGGTTLTAGPRAGSYIGGDGLEPGTAARREL